jgi:8-oxo-dGDP phosphatase
MGWRTESSVTKYENPWIQVREDIVVRPDGSPGLYGVLATKNVAVFVVALNESGPNGKSDPLVLLETIDRYTVGPSIEVPAGGADGQEPLLAAQRELAEETGYAADQWIDLGGTNALNGISLAPERFFLARGLRRTSDASATQFDEGIVDTQWLRFSEVVKMIADGKITDGESITAIALAGIHLGRFR